MNKLHLAFTLAAIGLAAACSSSSSDPAPASASDSGANSNGGDGDPSNGGDGDPSNGGDGDASSGNGDGDPVGDGDPAGDGDPGDQDTDAGLTDDDGGSPSDNDSGGGGNGPAGLSENQIIWDGETLNLHGPASCTANPDLTYSGNFTSTETPALGEELNAVIQFPGQGKPATGDSTGASYSMRPGSQMTGAYVPSTLNNDDASVFHVENINDTVFEFTWSEVEFPILGGETVISSGWVICDTTL